MHAAFAPRTRTVIGAVGVTNGKEVNTPISSGTFIFSKPVCIIRRPLRSQLDPVPPHFLSAQVPLCVLGEEADE